MKKPGKVYDVEVSGMAWVTFRLRVRAVDEETAKKFLVQTMKHWESVPQRELPEVVSVDSYPHEGDDFSIEDMNVEEVDLEEEKKLLAERRKLDKALRKIMGGKYDED